MAAELSDIGLIGLAVMGENLVLNMESKGFRVSVFNRTVAKVDEFVGEQGRGHNKRIFGAHTLEEFVGSLSRPRKVMIMVRAGSPVDSTISGLVPLLEPGDVIIDGGNSNFEDTNRRTKELGDKGLLFVGSGVSGGEEGALNGPSIMPGGASAAWPLIKEIFQAISAKVGADNSPCCDWVGDAGAGHYVKMVHNGVEYGDMQLISEAYHIMRDLLHMKNEEIAPVFDDWNTGDLDSYLIEITAQIFKVKITEPTDARANTYVVDSILDCAGQKGTGKWTTSSALDEGVPVTLIGEAVFARYLSSLKSERVEAAKVLTVDVSDAPVPDRAAFLKDLASAIFAAKVVSYAQGFALLRAAAKHYEWALEYGNVALMWRGGCIIRSKFLGNIKEAFDADPDLANLLLDGYFRTKMLDSHAAWRRVCVAAIQHGIPIPAVSSALAYFDGYRCASLPANLLQAQRDFFGAHTYERVDQPGSVVHTDWTGHGGSTSATTYTA